jgi:hypothetical protein
MGEPAFEIKRLPLRATQMDEYGVGYAMEVASGKSWKRATLYRCEPICLSMKTATVLDQSTKTTGLN